MRSAKFLIAGFAMIGVGLVCLFYEYPATGFGLVLGGSSLTMLASGGNGDTSP